jgi:hypothetical protein
MCLLAGQILRHDDDPPGTPEPAAQTLGSRRRCSPNPDRSPPDPEFADAVDYASKP